MKKPLIYVIEDDRDMSELLTNYLKRIAEVKKFYNAISAVNNIDEDNPSLILLDILLDGPDGFTFLNEIMSYQKTAKIPIILITSLEIGAKEDLIDYGVVEILNKESTTPDEIREVTEKWIDRNVKNN
ncbi:response regulator [Candidatus Saccharibacteria bacterium]|nr:response regulator [Candidatus Saccharibacteria bacterium]